MIFHFYHSIKTHETYRQLHLNVFTAYCDKCSGTNIFVSYFHVQFDSACKERPLQFSQIDGLERHIWRNDIFLKVFFCPFQFWEVLFINWYISMIWCQECHERVNNLSNCLQRRIFSLLQRINRQIPLMILVKENKTSIIIS